ncbi:MAG: hypothetical protein HN348_34810, partial [Proteobacteria bacterium]|nr:hypothetical protein [Pseudomonadota bacterium]
MAVLLVGGLIFLFTTLIVLIVYWMHLHEKAWAAALQAVAKKYGLTYEPGGWLSASKSEGIHEGRHICVDSYTVSTGKSSQTFTRIVVKTQLSRSLCIDSEGVMSSLKKAFGGDDVRVGDAKFDDKMLLNGNEVEVAARLDYRTRQLAYKAAKMGASLKGGEFKLTKSGKITDQAKLLGMVGAIVDLANALEHQGQSVNEMLLQNTLSDPKAGVRRRNLTLLLERVPQLPANAIDQLLADTDVVVRLTIAEVVGESAFPVLKEIAEDQSLSTNRRGRAIVLLARHCQAIAEAVQ